DRDRRAGGHHRPERADYAIARRDGVRGARDGAPRLHRAAADRRRANQPPAHCREDCSRVQQARGPRARRVAPPGWPDEPPQYGQAARELYDHARTLLDQIVRERLLTARGVYGFWPANSDNDDIVLYEPGTTRELLRFSMLRQQEQMPDAKPNRSLADLLAP